MKGFFKNKPLVILIAALLLLGILAFVTAGDRSVSFVESAAGTVIQPLQTFAAKASSAIIGFFQDMFNTTDADVENEQLKARLAQYEQLQQELEQYKAENDRLKKLLNYSEIDAEYEYVTASVIAKDQGVWFDTFTINAGRNHGLDTDMCVVCSSGLVGRVTDVGATWAKVTSIIDTRMSVSVLVSRTRDPGMITGTFSTTGNDALELYFLPSGCDLLPGDVIMTSGLGGVFPKGITIGTVTEVLRSSDDVNQTNAIVNPSVDFGHIEEVMVITGTVSPEGGEEGGAD